MNLRTAEDHAQFALLNTPLGGTGSGAARYAAAMYFFQAAQMTAQDLEVYRCLAKDDQRDPAPLLSRTDVPTEIPRLLGEIDQYLAAYDVPGVSDVRAGLARWSAGETRSIPPASLPACSCLEAALASVGGASLRSAITTALPFLHWVSYDLYPRSEIGVAFADGHAYTSLIGNDAFFKADDFELGLFIIAPNVVYRDHHHAAPELYAPLTGPHGWRFLPDTTVHWLAADVPVWNEPWAAHATITGDIPFLSIYCWTRDVNQPAIIVLSEDWHEIGTRPC